jgi:hypothetical protein
MAGTVRDRASQAADTARQRMASAADTARQQAERVRLGVDHLVNEQPLALGAIGLAVGALLGAAMPRTRQEDRMMGATRDRLVHDAEGALREPLERATQAASAAADAAVDTFRFETGEGPSSQGASKASSSASSSGPSSTSSSRDGSSEGFGQGSDLPSAAQSPTTPSTSVSTSGRPFPEAKGPGPQESGPGYESPRGAAPMSSTQYDVEDVDQAANRQAALGLAGDEPGAGTRAGDASGNPPAGR